MINKEDLIRLANEIQYRDKSPEHKFAWLEKHGIDAEGFALYISQETLPAFLGVLFEQQDMEGALFGTFGHAFQLGFEACEQFGGVTHEAVA